MNDNTIYSKLILDAGTGIRLLGEEILEKRERRESAILLTHYHWDHIQGLPFFSPAYEEGFDLKWWGPPLPLTAGALPTLSRRRQLQAAHVGRTVYGPDFARVAGAAEVFLGIRLHPTGEGSWGSRLYWALGCGATYLCRRVPGLDDVFESGRHLEVFGDAEECVEKTRALLNKSRLRMRLSVQGRQEVLARHTYHHRFERMREISHHAGDLPWE